MVKKKKSAKMPMFGDGDIIADGIKPEDIIKAIDMLDAAENLIKDFPKAWQHIKDMAEDDYIKGRPMSMQRYIEDARHLEWTGFSGRDFKVSNSIIPALSRLLIKEHPNYLGRIKLRPSIVDLVIDIVTGSKNEQV